MTNPFGRAGIPAMSQTGDIESPCVVCLSGCTLLFFDDPPLYVLCIQYCIENYCS